MALNPWVLLGLLLAFAGSNGWSFYEGRHYGTITIQAAQVAAVDKAASQATAEVKVDYAKQQELALEQQRHELLSETHQNLVVRTITQDKLVRVAAVKAAAASGVIVDCDMPASSFSVLIDSIRASNQGSVTTPGAVYGAVPSSNGASGSHAGSDAVRTGQHGMDPINVPK